MTLEQMGETGYNKTRREIKRFNSLLAAEYRKALDEINAEIQKIYNKIIGDRTPAEVTALLKEQPSWMWVQSNKFDRLKSLQKKVQTQYTKASIIAGNMTVESSKMAITNNFYYQQYGVAFASNDIPLSFSILNPKVVEVSVLGTPEVWKKITADTMSRVSKKYGDLSKYQPKHGTLISTILNNRKDDLRKLNSAITQGLIQGKSFSKTAKDVRKILKGSANQAIRVVRTEGNRNMNAGAFASHNAAVAQGIEIERQILATQDGRQREQSDIVNGQKADENNQFHYPGGLIVDFPGNSGNPAFDINDRETVIEIIEGQDPTQNTGTNPTTGKNEVMNFSGFDTWASDNGLRRNKTGRWVVK